MQGTDIRLGEGKIVFRGMEHSLTVVKSDRKSFGLTVNPDQSVILRLPLSATEEETLRFLQRKEPWLNKQLTFFEKFNPRTPERRFIGGETLLRLGKIYRLRIRAGSRWKRSIGKYYITITTPYPERPDLIKQHYMAWLKADAEDVFREIYLSLSGKITRVIGTDQLPGLQVRHFKAKWGAYFPGEKIVSLNYMLVQAGRDLMEYVFLHEIAHYRYPNHDRNFHNLLTRLCPDWKERKEKLERLMA